LNYRLLLRAAALMQSARGVDVRRSRAPKRNSLIQCYFFEFSGEFAPKLAATDAFLCKKVK
jgi:hypothetical protein